MSSDKLRLEKLGIFEDEDGSLRIDEIDVVISAPSVPALTHDVPETRLVITELIVRDFKSYAGEQVLGPFDKNFTAIVGPNGSGKSNVIDALLFVFGRRSQKIRSKKISQLIHKSEQYPNCTSCSVTVNFATIKDEGDKFTVLPDSRFTLSRTVFSNETSYYEICNKRVRFSDVQNILSAYGIDMVHCRFLVLQGEIEAISLMNPIGSNDNETGMLEYVEDVIGSSRFIEPIKTIEAKVKALGEEREVKLNHLKMAQKEKDELEDPKNKAIEFLKLENKLYLLEHSLLHINKFETETELENIIKDKEDLVNEINTLKKKLETVRASKKSIDCELHKLNEHYDALLKTVEEAREQYKDLERQDVAYAEDTRHAKTKIEDFEKDLENLKIELNKLSKQLTIYEKETTELTEMKKKLTAEKSVEETKLTELTKELIICKKEIAEHSEKEKLEEKDADQRNWVMGSVTQENDMLQEKKDKSEKELIALKNIVYQLKSEMNLSQSEFDLYVSGEKKAVQQLSSLESSYEQEIQASKKDEKLLHEEQEQIRELENELSSLNPQLADTIENERNIAEEIRSCRLKLEEVKNSVYTSRHHSSMMQAFMKEKANGRLTGIYGRLGDLGAIDEKYDVAISTACGQLDNIVTDTLTTAQECVQFLKKNKLGYTTFIPLDKMKIWESYSQKKISTPENVPRLYDLIHVKDKCLLPAFYFALRDTLVAEDLEQATRIGLQGKTRYRVVTLKGQLIDLAGTMTGGGNKVVKGRMGQTVIENSFSSEDVEKMNADLNNLYTKLSDLKRLHKDLEDQISQRSKQLSSVQHSVKKRKLHCTAHRENIEMLKTQIAEMKQKIQECAVDKQKVQMLKEKIEEKKKKYIASSEEASVVEERVAKLQAEILKNSKGKVNKVQKAVDLLTKKISDVSQAITKSSVNIKTSKRNIKKIEEKISTIEKEIVVLKEQVRAILNERNIITNVGIKIVARRDEALAGIQQCKEKRANLKKEVEQLAAEEHQIKLTEIEYKNKFKNHEVAESEKRAVIKNISAKLQKLKLHDIEEEQGEFPELTREDVAKLSVKTLTSDIELVKLQMESMTPNLSAINEYKIKEKLFNEKQKEVDEITQEKNRQKMRSDELSKRRLAEFMSGFTAIAKKLREIYQMLTFGGGAEIELIDPFEPFEKGILFSVKPQGKSWKLMKNLSGGEKTLSSLSLVFALHYYKPTPFYVMDEIDAALDQRNVRIVSYFLKERTKNTQFIIVSLRDTMNEVADLLLGIYKINNCTKNVCISNVEKWKDEN